MLLMVSLSYGTSEGSFQLYSSNSVPQLLAPIRVTKIYKIDQHIIYKLKLDIIICGSENWNGFGQEFLKIGIVKFYLFAPYFMLQIDQTLFVK